MSEATCGHCGEHLEPEEWTLSGIVVASLIHGKECQGRKSKIKRAFKKAVARIGRLVRRTGGNREAA